MSDAAYQEKQSLGVLKIISNGISLLVQNPILTIGIALLVQIFWMALNVGFTFGLFGINPFNVSEVLQVVSNRSYQAFSTIISIVGYVMTIGIITMANIDAHNGYGIRLGLYLTRCLKKFFVILILTVLTYVLASIPIVLLVGLGSVAQSVVFAAIFGLVGVGVFAYIFAMFSVVTPAILAENIGFGALSRSRILTKGYRGSIIGVMVLLFAMLLILLLLAAAVIGVFGAGGNFGVPLILQATTGSLTFQVINLLVGSVLIAYFAAVNVSIFERLRSIKNGIGLVEVANVFE